MDSSADSRVSSLVLNRIKTARHRPIPTSTSLHFVKRIFLTGASAGIGLATAKALVAAGHEVWGTSRDSRRIPKMPRLYPVALDLTDIMSVRRSFREALGEAGDFDVVINNAGNGYFGTVESLCPEIWQDQFQVLLIAQVELCRLSLEAMHNHGSGLIINVSSL